MVKGFNRRVVVMKNPDSKFFDEAFFVVKENAVFSKFERSPIESAKKIISDMEKENKKSKSQVFEIIKAVFFLALGIAVGFMLN